MAIAARRGLVLLFFRLRFGAAVSAACFGESARVAMIRDLWLVMYVSLRWSLAVTNRGTLDMMLRFVLPSYLFRRVGERRRNAAIAAHSTNSRQLLTLVTLASYEFQLYWFGL